MRFRRLSRARVAFGLVLILVAARPVAATAEAAGYGGTAGTLKAQITAPPSASSASSATSATDTPDPTGRGGGRPIRPAVAAIRVEGTGFLADSRVTIHVPHAAAVRTTADSRGAIATTVPLATHPTGRLWVAATGTDPSFQARSVTTSISSGGAGAADPGRFILGALAIALIASLAWGPLRHRARRPHRGSGHTTALGAAA